MEDSVRRTLGELVARHGPGLADDSRRCEGLLRDFAGAHRREIFVLVSAAEEGVAADLRGARGGAPPALLFGQLARRLEDNRALSPEAARWAVDSWALALGIAPPAQAAAPTAPATTGAPPPAAAPPPRRAGPAVVSASGGGDYASIGEALAAAPEGARVLVRPGVYDEGLVIRRRVELVGDGPAGAVVVRSASASCVRMAADAATVRNLTLRGVAAGSGGGFFAVDVPGGRLVLEDCDVSSDSLACVGVHGPEARPVLRRCRLHGGADAGLYAFDGAGGELEDCEVRGNANVNVAITGGANPRLVRCRVSDGGNAGVVSWSGGAGVLERCEVFGNAQAGVGVSHGGNPVVRDCRIYGGANTGVFVHDGGFGEFSGCEITGNAEAEVAVSSAGHPAVSGCRIHGGVVGVIVSDGGGGVFEDCAIYGNSSAGVAVRAGAAPAFRRCAIRDNGVGVRAQERGRATLEACELTGNAAGPWDVDVTSALRTSGMERGV